MCRGGSVRVVSGKDLTDSHANGSNIINVTYDHSFDKDLLCIARGIDRKTTAYRHWGSIFHHFDMDYCRKDSLLERVKAGNEDITKREAYSYFSLLSVIV